MGQVIWMLNEGQPTSSVGTFTCSHEIELSRHLNKWLHEIVFQSIRTPEFHIAYFGLQDEYDAILKRLRQIVQDVPRAQNLSPVLGVYLFRVSAYHPVIYEERIWYYADPWHDAEVLSDIASQLSRDASQLVGVVIFDLVKLRKEDSNDGV